MRGLVEIGLVAVLLVGAGACPEDRPEPEHRMDAGLDGDARVDEELRTEVPDELVGTWQSGSIDFVRWENYTQGYWAGRNAIPSRESMTFHADGSAKFYRYEFAFNLYEELVDCEGTVAFHDDGTFTFYPTQGRKRFYDARYSAKNTDRELTADELLNADWAGTRAYTFDPISEPPSLRIVVPSSAAYNWYKTE